ncbi:Zinc finger, C2H2 [Cynara cardunculus var. scolymus]|uniref:Zinc finger, C2H2 n=1 Tax=Cynara cardunculus var. scolymus TaxID=59895 RepID=A0A103YB86_CYNCS|nr:Zinc finger, C2H2 [Cynara cardunculus var. scolymus]
MQTILVQRIKIKKMETINSHTLSILIIQLKVNHNSREKEVFQATQVHNLFNLQSFFHHYPEAEVISLSPKTLMATNRFVCEICNKGFQRDQNLQLHRRGHNLPWKLKQRNKNEVVKKKVYVCPEVNCVHHEPSRALGDLTGIKKHFCRKHGEKKWKCDKCSKRYAVQSDWKAHSKTCGTREYRCDCGTLFSR